MINLLPPDVHSSYRYAQRNTHLLRWVAAAITALLGLACIGAWGIISTAQASKSLEAEVETLNGVLAAQNLGSTKAETESISGSIKLAVTVLSKEIMFSKLLEKLGQITPSNASLIDLNISQEQKGVDITAQTADYNAATQLQVNLADPANKLFEKADIVSINCVDKAEGGEAQDGGEIRYPCTVVIRALFVKDNPFLFINGEKKKP